VKNNKIKVGLLSSFVGLIEMMKKQFVKRYSGEDTRIAAATYFPFVSTIVILLRKNNSEFVSFHAHQALVLLLIALLGIIIVPGPGKLIVFIAVYTLLVYGAYIALQGRKWYLPIVTEIANTIYL